VLVTISGLPGAGTSTLASGVATAIGIEWVDGGKVFRQLAQEKSLTLAEFGALAESDPSIDVALDQRLAGRARAGDVVLESRLAGWIATNEGLTAIRVWVGCDVAVRAERVASREASSVDDALTTNRRREASERLRYRTYYGIDLDDLSVYDVRLDSTDQQPDPLVSTIVAAAQAH
jgi:cytidylate kinase